jgi:hypothetical protein
MVRAPLFADLWRLVVALLTGSTTSVGTATDGGPTSDPDGG